MRKVVLFGDSFLARMSRDLLLAIEAKAADCDVYNCAAGGWSTADCLKKAPYIARLKPESIVISLGTNDALPWRHTTIDAFKANLTQLLDYFPDSKFIYLLPPPVDAARLEPDEQSLTNEILKRYSDASQAICEAHDIPVIDSWKLFKPLLDQGTDYHIEDGVHLNNRGYGMVIDVLSGLLNSMA